MRSLKLFGLDDVITFNRGITFHLYLNVIYKSEKFYETNSLN